MTDIEYSGNLAVDKGGRTLYIVSESEEYIKEGDFGSFLVCDSEGQKEAYYKVGSTTVVLARVFDMLKWA